MKSSKLDCKRERDATRPAKDKPGGGTPMCEGWSVGEVLQSAIWSEGLEIHAAAKTKGLSMCWKSQKCLRIITWELGLLLPKRWWDQQPS